MQISKKLASAVAVCALAGAFSAPAALAGPPDDGKCNAGRGNLSETTPETDCDPGNSGGRNQGGD